MPHDDSVLISVFLRRFAAGPFGRVFGLSILALTMASIFLWFFEARRNPDHFGGTILQGIGSALWWSVVFGANLGGNLTPIGSASTLVAVTIIHRNKIPLSFGAFVVKAIPYALVQLVMATAYVLLALR